MSIHQPYDWNVVVLGAWNRAILTPSGIATRLFELEEGIPVEVQVPIEGLGYPKVSYGGLTVTANSSRLVIELNDHQFDSLERSMSIARNAIVKLPETPLNAAGFNIRFKGSSLDTVFPDITRSAADMFSDLGYDIFSKSTEVQLEYKAGVINVKGVVDANGDLTVGFNFHRDSKTQDELIDWLSIPIGEIESEIEKLIGVLGLTSMERV